MSGRAACREGGGEKSWEWPSVASFSSSSSPDYYASVSRKGKGGEEREEGPVRTYVRTQTLFFVSDSPSFVGRPAT